MHCLLSQLSHKDLVLCSHLRIFAFAMEIIRFDVVGLYHWDVRSHWKEYATEAVGRLLTMQPQPENVKDPYAVRVREGLQHIGYVAVPDLDVIYQALKGTGKQRLKGKVVESNPEPPVLTVEAEVEKVEWDYEPFDDTPFVGWHYDGISLIPKKLEQLGDLTTDLTDALESAQGNDITDQGIEEVISMAESLLLEHLYDASREMTRARYRLEKLFSERSEPELQAIAKKLRQQKGMLMRHENRDKIARYLFIDLPRQLQQKGLEDSHYTYDNRLDELEQQLRAFPYQLYDKFLSDPVDFLREVYYKHVPRKHLFPLLSGIVLMILKRRVRINKWGREGDTEPIKQIESLAPPMSPSEREKTMKAALKELLEKEDANNHKIICYKNQWAGLISILTFDYHVPSTDLRDMCKKMCDWGFGEDSGFENYCDYDSVIGCSEYANKAFTDWRGFGTAHNRQVKAATELRKILRPKIKIAEQ